MEYFWRENKKYVVMLGAGIVFFLLYYNMVLGSMYTDADKAARDLNMEIMNLKARPTRVLLKRTRSSRGVSKVSLSRSARSP